LADAVARNNNIPAEQAVPLLHMGRLLGTLGRPSEAERCFRAAVTLTPESAEAHLALGRALHGLGRTGESVAHHRIACDLDPGHRLDLALAAYPDARVSRDDQGVILHPSRPAIPKL